MRDANGVVCEVGMGGSIDVRSGPSGVVGFRRKKVVPSHLEIVRKPLCNHQLPYGCTLRTKKLPVAATQLQAAHQKITSKVSAVIVARSSRAEQPRGAAAQ